ncbi:hypothetical protein NDU88_007761 [Pleurodeles waltl]|uniref:Uncharacterized protein n=1 Tax=Pleurodeles waltl TaxID=8319 RepID=A0AAV7PMT8_PLEWA|nr:hypothetical protein NDU88_007761 [Pleurodeles waltl]
MASSRWSGRRPVAADVPKGWCGSKGVSPTDAAALGEQRPGPSGIRGAGESGVMPVGCEVCGGCGWDRVHSGGEHRVEDSDASLEESEMVESRSESDWWERERGTGLLILSFSHFRRRRG